MSIVGEHIDPRFRDLTSSQMREFKFYKHGRRWKHQDKRRGNKSVLSITEGLQIIDPWHELKCFKLPQNLSSRKCLWDWRIVLWLVGNRRVFKRYYLFSIIQIEFCNNQLIMNLELQLRLFFIKKNETQKT